MRARGAIYVNELSKVKDSIYSLRITAIRDEYLTIAEKCLIERALQDSFDIMKRAQDRLREI